MNNFDEFLKRKIKTERDDVPEKVKNKIEETLNALPEEQNKKIKFKPLLRAASFAACFVFLFLIIIPNCSSVYANALEKLPVIGGFVKVVTIRNYFYSDSNHEMNINVPKIEDDNSDAANYINKDVSELSQILVDRFYSDLEEIGDEGHSSVYVEYDVITNTDKWFTLKIRVYEAAGSSNTYYKYYHIDKSSGKIVQLSDIVADDDFYTAVENDIKRQMKNQMEADENIIYWLEKSDFGWEFTTLDKNHNFYWNENYDLVISFDKYEVAPGSMGTPQFVVDNNVFKEYLNSEIKRLCK